MTALQFCEKCGNMLFPKKDEEGKIQLICRKCNITIENTTIGDSYKLKREVEHQTHLEERLVIDEEYIAKAYPKAPQGWKCPKCGSERAIYYQLQLSRGDEPMTNFIKCVRCNHTSRWRG